MKHPVALWFVCYNFICRRTDARKHCRFECSRMMLQNAWFFTILRNQIVFSAGRLSKVVNVVKHRVLVEHGRCNGALLYLKENNKKCEEIKKLIVELDCLRNWVQELKANNNRGFKKYVSSPVDWLHVL